MPPVAAVVGFRLGAQDGVSVQAATWMRALSRLGYAVRRVAGELGNDGAPGDVVVPGLAVAPAEAVGPDGQVPAGAAPPTPGELEAALAGTEVIVVENVLSLPLNLAAADVLAPVLSRRLAAGARVVLHHHDLAWQRAECAHLPQSTLPPELPGALHVTVNDFSRAELAERGVVATTVRNAFDLDAPQGRRDPMRATLGAAAADVVVLQPTRAVARKNIPAALRLAGEVAARLPDRTVRYWLPGPAEDGYGATLAELVAYAPVPVVRSHPSSLGRGLTMADAYAACDLVAFPSTEGEGFGQPVIESVWARRPLAVGRYRALDEIVGLGFEFCSVDEADAVTAAVVSPDTAVLDRNLARAREHFSFDVLVRRLGMLLHRARS